MLKWDDKLADNRSTEGRTKSQGYERMFSRRKRPRRITGRKFDVRNGRPPSATKAPLPDTPGIYASATLLRSRAVSLNYSSSPARSSERRLSPVSKISAFSSIDLPKTITIFNPGFRTISLPSYVRFDIGSGIDPTRCARPHAPSAFKPTRAQFQCRT